MRKNMGACVLMSLCFLLPAGAAETEPACRTAALSEPVTVATAGIEAIFSTGKPTLKSTCSASATCNGTTISCFGSLACSAVDQDCSVGQRGYVLCDNIRTSCPSDCPPSPDPCGDLNQQYPACNYTYDPQGSCCVPSHWSCPQAPCF